MNFEVISKIEDVQIIAIGNSIKEINRLVKYYGQGRWRKMKGIANIKLYDDSIYKAELHWYEAHGIGKKDLKIKKIITI